MNPYVNKALRSATKQEAFFAPEVYREESAARSERGAVGDELGRLRSELRGEARALRSALARPRVPQELVAEIATLRAAVDELLATPKRGDAIAKAIRARGIEGAAGSALSRAAKRAGVGGDLRAATASIVDTSPWPPSLANQGRALIALVGPAGVGKTTTAAKLAARALMAKKSVALVSCDAFRVGAMEQLGKYAELMDVRFHTAATQHELAEVVRTEDADVIIVDTSGRPVDPEATEAILGSEEIRSNKRSGRRVEVLLCVAASLRSADATRVRRDFATVKPTALVITKIDETDAPAGIIHAAFTTKLPISTLCTGQRVPEDISPATKESIARHLFPMNEEGDSER